MYADDIALYKPIKEPSSYIKIQEDILSLNSWITDHQLKLNASKCCYMIFSLLSEKVALST